MNGHVTKFIPSAIGARCNAQPRGERETLGHLVDAQRSEQRPPCRTRRRDFALNSQSQTIRRTMNCQSDNQSGSDFAEVPRGINIEVTGCTSRTNMMDMFADEKEKRVAGGERQDHLPPRTGAEAFRQNCEERYAEKSSGSKTDQCAQLLVRQAERRADGSADEGKYISRDDFPERVGHSGSCDCRRRWMLFEAMVCLDRDVNQFVVAAKQRAVQV